MRIRFSLFTATATMLGLYRSSLVAATTAARQPFGVIAAATAATPRRTLTKTTTRKPFGVNAATIVSRRSLTNSTGQIKASVDKLKSGATPSPKMPEAPPEVAAVSRGGSGSGSGGTFWSFPKDHPFAFQMIVATAKTMAADLMVQTVAEGKSLQEVRDDGPDRASYRPIGVMLSTNILTHSITILIRLIGREMVFLSCLVRIDDTQSSNRMLSGRLEGCKLHQQDRY
jgi:hypothetical protein